MTNKNFIVKKVRQLFSPHLKDLRKRDIGVVLGAIVMMLIAFYTTQIFQSNFEQLHTERMQSLPGQILIVLLSGILIFQALFLAYYAYLYFSYQPISSVDDNQLPLITIIVPAYNEGELVYHTLQSIAKSNYPKNKMEIMAIDDGSKDDTWTWIEKGKKDLGNLVSIYKQPANKGKRHALYRGFTTGKGEVFITIDSDSIIEEDTLRNMVSPFSLNKNCGGVAGNVKVLNKKQGFIPRMLNVSFTFSFEFVRAAQSKLGFVLCTPGALSAYKKEAIEQRLEEWLDQKFLGQAAGIGEDRAMTNMILAQGYDVLFQKNANVLTNTPITYRNLHKMFTRWGRSNVRETLEMNKFMFTNFRKKHTFGARLVFADAWLKLLLAIPFLLLMFYFLFSHPILFLSSALVGSFVFSSIQMLFFTKRYNFIEALWAYPYSVLYLFGLFWVFPFSIATVKNGGWLTR